MFTFLLESWWIEFKFKHSKCCIIYTIELDDGVKSVDFLCLCFICKLNWLKEYLAGKIKLFLLIFSKLPHVASILQRKYYSFVSTSMKVFQTFCQVSLEAAYWVLGLSGTEYKSTFLVRKDQQDLCLRWRIFKININ